ncbi:DUF3732 domain-containing protein [Myroides odoratimimus]|uniref:DUF3732 domain-containing protein n=1 Tax=Myroides odoratimimus TaxID=76832 RepID=UPI000923289A|nr:DUF3732 domain-containing protein [Myroides odoratimimus]SHM36193.1 Protein of unknown function [Myroides odoratimimus subsp. xuanwuensis]
MKLTIETIILYPTNKSLKPRFIKLSKDKINIITGYSKRGKSSIIEIIDYCLGNTESNIPIGKIRDYVDIFALKINLNGHDAFIARDSPKDSKMSSLNMYYVEIDEKGEYSQFNTNDWILDKENFRENRDSVKNILNSKAGFQNVSDNTENPITVGFRDTTAFQFQSQSIIANGNTIFYNTDSFFHIDRLRTIFPLVLGYKSFEILILDDEVKVLESEEKKLLNKIEDINTRYENWKFELYEYYSEAIKLGLTNKDIDIESSNVDLIKDELQTIISNVRENILIKEGTTVVFSEKIRNLEDQRLIFMRELTSKKSELSKILRFETIKKEYFDTVYTEVKRRLRPIDWFLEQEGTDTCPFCKSKSNLAFEQLQNLKEYNEENNKLIGVKNSNILSFEKEKIELKKSIKKQENLIHEFDKNIKILAKDTREEHNSYQKVYEFIGKVSNFLKNLNSPDEKYSIELFELQKTLKEKRIKLLNLKKKFNKEHSLSKLTKIIKEYIDLLPIENKEYTNVLLDPEKYVGIKIEDKRDGTTSFLNKIGSGSNYMCYHLATILGLHEFFYKLKDNSKINYVPSFLVLDQPSQVYYPEQLEEKVGKNTKLSKEESEDLKNTRKIFEVCSEFMERTNNEIQIIILEHAPEKTWEGINNINLVEEWRGKEDDGIYSKDYKALIPQEWLLY